MPTAPDQKLKIENRHRTENPSFFFSFEISSLVSKTTFPCIIATFFPFSFIKFFPTMDFRSKGITLHSLFVSFLLFSAIFPLSFSAANQPHKVKNLATPRRLSSSAVFKVQGNVYPLGYVVILSLFFGQTS